MQPNIRVMLFDEDGERFFGEVIVPPAACHRADRVASRRRAVHADGIYQGARTRSSC